VDALNGEHAFAAGQIVLMQFSYRCTAPTEDCLPMKDFHGQKQMWLAVVTVPYGLCNLLPGRGGDSERVTLFQKEIINAAPHVRVLFR
jgi:hypothetical protein